MEVLGNVLCDDDSQMVTDAINDWIGKGAEFVVCTGGMSVDPDDRTPLSIRNATDEVITYGAPVLRERCSCWLIKERFRLQVFRDA